VILMPPPPRPHKMNNDVRMERAGSHLLPLPLRPFPYVMHERDKWLYGGALASPHDPRYPDASFLAVKQRLKTTSSSDSPSAASPASSERSPAYTSPIIVNSLSDGVLKGDVVSAASETTPVQLAATQDGSVSLRFRQQSTKTSSSSEAGHFDPILISDRRRRFSSTSGWSPLEERALPVSLPNAAIRMNADPRTGTPYAFAPSYASGTRPFAGPASRPFSSAFGRPMSFATPFAYGPASYYGAPGYYGPGVFGPGSVVPMSWDPYAYGNGYGW
jgi:hypothetical protein